MENTIPVIVATTQIISFNQAEKMLRKANLVDIWDINRRIKSLAYNNVK